MASAISLPTFYEKERLTYQKLNAAMSSINTKFQAGVGSAELTWPMTADGNLDMSIYNITGGRQIWGYVNAAEYDTLDDAIAAAGSGGVVLVPPETTVVANGAVMTGTGATVIGSGPSSVLKLTADASSGYLLKFDGCSNCLLANLTIDGNGKTGTDQDGVQFASCSVAHVYNVYFQASSGACLSFSGNNRHVSVMGCFFHDSRNHIAITQAREIVVTGCTFNTCTGPSVDIACASGSANTALVLGDCAMVESGGEFVRFEGYNSIGSVSPGRLWLSNVQMYNGTGATANVLAGTSAAVLEEVHIANCSLRSSNAGALLVNANGGVINGNEIIDPVTYGIDVDTSRYLVVSGNYIYAATIGLDMSAGQSCSVNGNILRSCTTPVAFGGTNHVISNNVGASYGHPYGNVSVHYDGSYPSAGTGTITNINIPAGVLKQGSIVRVYVSGNADHSGSVEYVYLRYGTQVFAKCTRPDPDSGPYYVIGELFISSCANETALGHGHGLQQGTERVIGGSTAMTAVTGVDCSAVVPINIYSTGGTATVQGVTVWYGHAEQQAL